MKNLKLISILLFTFFVFSCKKDKPNNTHKPASYVLGPKSIIIDNPSSQVIQAVDSVKVVFNGNTTQLQNLTVGNIIISGIAPNAPYGFLRKITNIQKTGTTYTFATVEVPLEEAFEELHVDYTKPFTTADTTLRVTNTNFTIDIPNIILYDADGNNSTTTDQIKLSENVELTPSFRFAVDISRFKLQYAIVEGNFQTVLDQTLTAGGTVGSISKEINIFEKPLAAYPLPGLPFLVVVPNLRVSLGANANLNVSVSASQTITSNVTANIEYKNSNWDKHYTQTLTTTHTTPSISGSASAKIYVEPSIDFKLYNSNWAKGSVVAQGYLKATGTLLPTPDCELKAGLSAGAEANLQFFGWNFAAVSYPDIFDYSKVLYTCNNANNLPVADFSASQTNINTGSSVSFTDLSFGSPTSWSWTFQGGTPATSTAQNPTVQYNTAGTYTVTLTATNANGSNTKTKTAYIVVNNSNSIFNPNLTYGTMTDIDGNIYKTIQIGTQTWMAENLKATHYKDGTIIPDVTDNTAWGNLTTGAWCYYNNDVINNTVYGKLYNWYAVNTGKLAPVGWHVPTNAEWTILINYLGGDNIAGGKLKATTLWDNSYSGTNISGFTAIPNNSRDGFSGQYINSNNLYASWWTSTQYNSGTSNVKGVSTNNSITSGFGLIGGGLSVRCVKD